VSAPTATLRDRLGIELPILQAPMAGAQGSALAIAVCAAGGLGALPTAMLAPDAMRDELAAVRAATSRPFNVNFFCHTEPTPDPAREAAWRATLAPYYHELGLDVVAIPVGATRKPFDADAADVLRELAPPVVSFHFGLPSRPLLDVIRRTGATILSTATTVDEARWLEERGVHSRAVRRAAS
jgi:nitronate monooxygenase